MISNIQFLTRLLAHNLKPFDSPEAYYQSLHGDVVPGTNQDMDFLDKVQWMNVGFWKEARTYIQANKDLALELANHGQFCGGLSILDVGSGAGAQDFLWARDFDLSEIEALDITPQHVIAAKTHLSNYSGKTKIKFNLGNACQLDYPADRFDRVIALDCAYHFDIRESFLRQAYRVLRPGGKLVVSDMLPDTRGIVNSPLQKFLRRSICIPKKNLYPIDIYEKKLKEIGYHSFEVKDVTRYVFTGFYYYIFNRALHPNTAIKDLEVIFPKEKFKTSKAAKIWGFYYGTPKYFFISATK